MPTSDDKGSEQAVGAAHARPAKLPTRKQHHLMTDRYSDPGAYFLTICTKGRKCVFGIVQEELCLLSWIGEVVNQCWLAVPDHLPGVYLDCYSVMPNHFHGIVWIGIKHAPVFQGATQSKAALAGRACAAPTVQLPPFMAEASLPRVVNSFKSAVTREVNRRSNAPRAKLWGDDYWDGVIRNEQELHDIRSYILSNPLSWHLDRENTEREHNSDANKWEFQSAQ